MPPCLFGNFSVHLIGRASNYLYWRFASVDAASGSPPSCRYVKGQWSECDSKTNTRSRTLNLKKGDKSCDQIKIIQKKCKKGKPLLFYSLFISTFGNPRSLVHSWFIFFEVYMISRLRISLILYAFYVFLYF